MAVFRLVLANPDTTHAILQDILDEQRALAAASPCMAPLMALVAASDAAWSICNWRASSGGRPGLAGNGHH